MPEIRTLRPVMRIRMPKANTNINRPSRVKVVRRTQETHPSPTPQPTPCRLWQGAAGSDGYGWRKIDEGSGRKPISMHRWVMQETLGRKLRRDEIVLHACDNPFCYRVDHLSIGTVQSNNADMRAKGRDTKPPVNVFHGECHPMAKLTEAQVRAIRGHRQSGLHIKTIAAMFDVAPSTIRRICSGVTWNYVGEPSGYGIPTAVKPPTRDLLAEARAKYDYEKSLLEAPAADAAEPHPQRNTAVKPIRKITLGGRQ